MNQADSFALVPRPPTAVEKAEPGPKRILSGMVADTLAHAKSGPSSTRKTLRISHPAVPQFICELGHDLRLRLQARSERDQSIWHWTGWGWQRDTAESQEKDKHENPDDPRLESAVEWLRSLDWFCSAGIVIADPNEGIINRLNKHLQLRPEHAEFLADPGFQHLWQKANLDATGLKQFLDDDAKSWREIYAHAVERLRRTAAQGVAGAQRELGQWYHNDNREIVAQDHAEAVNWFRKAAEQGDADAQRLLGGCYRDGKGVPQDQAKAVEWYRRAADQGDAIAQYLLAGCYVKGTGAFKDYAEAVKWYREAAEQDMEVAQYKLGECYQNGEGVPQDHAEAVRWYRKAAEKDVAEAHHNLGQCYENGEGVVQDYCEAYKFYKLASDQEDQEALKNMDALRKRMTSAELSEGERRYRESSTTH